MNAHNHLDKDLSLMTPIGTVAIVTGGSQGIGLEIVKHLLRAGMDVMIMARREPVIAEACAELASVADMVGRRVAGRAGDVSSPDDVAAVVSAAAEEFGNPAQVLVNCAGIGNLHRLLDLPLDAWQSIFDVHVTGTFLMTQAVGRSLRDASLPGSFINITSLNGNTPTAGLAHYCAAKAAVAQFTQVSAIELAPFRIRVNSVAPGAVLTPLVEPYLTPDMREGYVSRTPLGRLGAPQDIARVVAFLASEESGWITGTALPVDGGAHMMGLHNYADAVGLP